VKSGARRDRRKEIRQPNAVDGRFIHFAIVPTGTLVESVIASLKKTRNFV
jgi:hypothetical protein